MHRSRETLLSLYSVRNMINNIYFYCCHLEVTARCINIPARYSDILKIFIVVNLSMHNEHKLEFTPPLAASASPLNNSKKKID